MFKSVDSDNNGTLSEPEFSELVRKMQICDSDGEINYFLQIVDPYNNQQIIFSEIVHLFSAHMVPLDETSDRQIPMLEKFQKMMTQDDEGILNKDL